MATLILPALVCRVSHADPGDMWTYTPPVEERRAPEAPSPPRPPTPWYGWQVLLIDAAAMTMILVATKRNEQAMGTAAVWTYLLGPPTLHAARGRCGHAAGSLGLRAGAVSVVLVAPPALLFTYPTAVLGDAALLSGESRPAGQASFTLRPMVTLGGAF